jgi:hypothetical protein
MVSYTQDNIELINNGTIELSGFKENIKIEDIKIIPGVEPIRCGGNTKEFGNMPMGDSIKVATRKYENIWTNIVSLLRTFGTNITTERKTNKHSFTKTAIDFMEPTYYSYYTREELEEQNYPHYTRQTYTVRYDSDTVIVRDEVNGTPYTVLRMTSNHPGTTRHITSRVTIR